MSRAGSTTNLPSSTTHNSMASDAAAPLQSERLSDGTIDKLPRTRTDSENVRQETPVDNANVLWVDWDGPEDPMNPKKLVARLLFVIILT